MIELTTPVTQLGPVRIDGFVGAFVQHIIEVNVEDSTDFEDSRGPDYDKEVGFSAIADVRFTFDSSDF